MNVSQQYLVPVYSLLLIFSLTQAPLLDQYQVAQKALAAEPKSEERLITVITLLYRMGHIERAVGILQPFVQSNPAAHRARVLLAWGYTRSEKYDQAQSLALQAASKIPGDYYAQHVLGLSLFGLNRFDESEARFKRSIELKPDFPDSHFQLGALRSGKADSLEQARASFKRAQELGHSPAEVLKEIASIDIKLGRFPDAIEELKTSVKLKPDYADAYFLLADALRKTGSAEEAADAIKKFQSLNATLLDKRSRQNRSQALYQTGMGLLFGPGGVFIKANFAKAYEAFSSAAEALPELEAAYYRMAQIDFLGGNPNRAVPNIRLALKLNPFEPEYYFVLASILETADLRGAIEAAGKAVSLNPGVAEFHNLLGLLLDKAGDYRSAIGSYRRASELDPTNEAFRLNLAAALRKAPGIR